MPAVRDSGGNKGCLYFFGGVSGLCPFYGTEGVSGARSTISNWLARSLTGSEDIFGQQTSSFATEKDSIDCDVRCDEIENPFELWRESGRRP